jgi:hypothetical protein
MKLKLSFIQLRVINEIYKRMKNTYEWPELTEVLLRIEKELKSAKEIKEFKKEVKKLSKLYPPFIQKLNGKYALTPSAFWLCIQSDEESKNLLLNFLRFLREKLNEPLSLEKISSKEVASGLNLNQEEISWLGKIIQILGLHNGGIFGKEGWEIRLGEDIVDLIRVRKPEECIQQKIDKKTERLKQIKKREFLEKAKKKTLTIIWFVFTHIILPIITFVVASILTTLIYEFLKEKFRL